MRRGPFSRKLEAPWTSSPAFTVVIAEEEGFAGMNEEWLKWFPSNPPARQGAKLPVRVPGLKVSIAAIAEA
jgi:2-iminobutanoate/2-iminopropanoate deaminase